VQVEGGCGTKKAGAGPKVCDPGRVMSHHVITVPAPSSPALGPSDVITGLVPVIPIKRSSALHSVGMAGTTPSMTRRVSSPTAAGRYDTKVSDPGADAARDGGATIQ